MSHAAKKKVENDADPVRVLGRGLRAKRGIRLTLRALREAIGKTQADVSDDSGIDQGDVSRLEKRSHFQDCQVETLERILSALGGRLDLVAVFGERRISIAGIEDDVGPPANRALQRTTRLPRSARSPARR